MLQHPHSHTWWWSHRYPHPEADVDYLQTQKWRTSLLHNCSDKATYRHECQHSPLNRKLVRVCIVTTCFAGTHTHAVHIPGLQGTQAEVTRVNAHSNTIQVVFQRHRHSVCAVHWVGSHFPPIRCHLFSQSDCSQASSKLLHLRTYVPPAQDLTKDNPSETHEQHIQDLPVQDSPVVLCMYVLTYVHQWTSTRLPSPRLISSSLPKVKHYTDTLAVCTMCGAICTWTRLPTPCTDTSPTGQQWPAFATHLSPGPK